MRMGETHGEWITPVISEAYNAGYTEAYPHAAKHTVEKVLEIAEKHLDNEAYQILLTALRCKECWE